MRPPLPLASGAPPSASTPVALDAVPEYRLPVWSVGQVIYTAVVAKDAMWIWAEHTQANTNSGWLPMGAIPSDNEVNKTVLGLVHLSDGIRHRLIALRDRSSDIRDPHDVNDAWRYIPTTTSGGATVSLRKIASIISQATLEGDLVEGLIGTTGDPAAAGTVYRVDIVGTEGRCAQVLGDVASDIAPAGIRRSDGSMVVVASVSAMPIAPYARGCVTPTAPIRR